MKKTHHRLGLDVVPHRYRITLKPDLEGFTFEGKEEIEVELKKSTKRITLHAAELEIFSAEFVQSGITHTGAVSYDIARETASFTFAAPLPKGRGTLRLVFAGILNNQMRGFYRSRYEHEGKTYHMGVSQFEATDARRALPCFDEPAHKAVFEVSLIVPNDRTAISNTLETSVREHSEGYKVVSFAPSPKMSSYLLAFIVGHFEHVEKKTKRGVKVRVFVTPGKKHQAEFALDCAARCIDFYEKYFGIKYPLPVADLIAIPDFAIGAMENWGAVTYRETAVLVDPVHTATANKQRVAVVIAHELAHQWFGNLVTMEWWTHLWLNEGFATYLEYVAVDHVYPEWDIWTQFIHQENGRALVLDSLDSTHAIEIDVRHPSEISEIFDAVSYAKGASVIRMLNDYIGEKAFRSGLSHYLKTHAYGNAETEDLWHAFEKASGKKVSSLMRAWTRNPGYPLVSLIRAAKGLALTQERFFVHPKKRAPGRWTIPLKVLVNRIAKPKQLLLKTSRSKLNLSTRATVKLNAGEKSFIRSAYAPEQRALLKAAIREGGMLMSEIDRYGFIRDTFALAESGRLTTAEALDTVRCYRGETSYIVWAVIAEHLNKIFALLHKTELEHGFKSFVLDVTADVVARVGLHPRAHESHSAPFLRSTVLTLAGMAGNATVIAQAKKLFSNLTKGKHVDPNLRALSYYLAAKNGGRREHAQLQKMLHATHLEEEKDRILRALCSTHNATLLKKSLAHGFAPHARGQDSLKAISLVWMNPFGRDVAWRFLRDNWVPLAKRYDAGHLYQRFIQPGGTENSIERAAEIKKFFAKQKTTGIARTVEQVIEQIHTNHAWLARDKKALKKYLRSSVV